MPWPHCISAHPNALILNGIEHQRVAYRGKSDAKLLTISLTAKQFSKKLFGLQTLQKQRKPRIGRGFRKGLCKTSDRLVLPCRQHR